MYNENILFKKNIFHFHFRINPKNIKYYDKNYLKLYDIRKYFQIKKDDNTKKEFQDITKFGININHAMFIKLIDNLEINFMNNILIVNVNKINLKSIIHYFLLHNKFHLLSNIYVNNLKNKIEYNKIKINLFNKKKKYYFIIFDKKYSKASSSDDKNLEFVEYEYINFLFNCISFINEYLHKNGSILLLFRYFYLEQVIDYIRLINHYFKNSKIYDFIITENDDLIYIYFECYNGETIKLKKKYFYFTEKVESEELDKLNIIMKNRYYLQKKILYYYSKNDNIYNNHKINVKKEIKLLKSIGYQENDIYIFTKNKYFNFLYYLKENDVMKIYNFDKNIFIPFNIKKNNIEEEINCHYIRITLPIYLIRNSKKYDFIDDKRFYKHTLKYLINEKLNVKYITRNWCKALQMYSYIFKNEKKNIRSFHLAEYPGNFIRALQYYSQNNFIILEDWKAQSYEAKKNMNISKNDWLFGDLLSKKNQKFYINFIKKFNANFITADGGEFTFKKNQISFELIKVEINIILNSLSMNGNCLIKLYLPCLECKDDIQCLYESFEQIYFLKSELNKNLPEFYIYCKNLQKRVLSIKKNKENIIFDNFYYIYIFKLLNIFENHMNMIHFMYQYYDILIKNNSQMIKNIIDEKNKLWMDKYI